MKYLGKQPKKDIAADVRQRLAKELLEMAAPSPGKRRATHTDATEQTQAPVAGAQVLDADPLYVPRPALHDRFNELVASGQKLIALVGLPGMGKNWLAKALATLLVKDPADH